MERSVQNLIKLLYDTGNAPKTISIITNLIGALFSKSTEGTSPEPTNNPSSSRMENIRAVCQSQYAGFIVFKKETMGYFLGSEFESDFFEIKGFCRDFAEKER